MRINKKEGNSLLISMFISESLICNLIDNIIPIHNISLFLMIFLGTISFYLNRKISMRSALCVGISWLLIVILLIISAFINGIIFVSNYILYFMVFGSVGAWLSIHNVDIKSVFKNLTIIYDVYFVVYYSIIRYRFLNSGDAYPMYSMGMAYAMTTIIYLSLVYYFYSDVIRLRKEIKHLLFVDSLFALEVMLIDCRSRGPILGIVIAFMILLIMKEKGLKKFAVIFVLGIGTLMFFGNYLSIIVRLNDFLNQHHIDVPALGKIIYLHTYQGGLSNGRNLYYSLAIEKIKRNILFGHGIGYFETLGMGYVHNLLLDILLSVGGVGFTLIGGIFLYYFYKIISCNSKEKQAYILLLLFVGVIMLIFSSSLWLYPPFWVFFFGIINIRQYKEFRSYRE